MQIIGRSVVGALAMGNAVVLNRQRMLALQLLHLVKFVVAGLPNGAINIVPGYGNEAGEFKQSSGINHVSFTGSVEVGSKNSTKCIKKYCACNTRVRR